MLGGLRKHAKTGGLWGLGISMDNRHTKWQGTLVDKGWIGTG